MRKHRKMISLIMLMAILVTYSPYKALAADATVAATSEEAAVAEEVQEADQADVVSEEQTEVEPAEETSVEEVSAEEAKEISAKEEEVAEDSATEEDAEEEEPVIEKEQETVSEETNAVEPETMIEDQESESDEIEIDGETVVTSNSSKGDAAIDAADTEEKTSMHIEIIWNDEDDYDGARPDDLEFMLQTDEELIETVELNEECGWQYTWNDLDKKDDKGNDINYHVVFEEPNYFNYYSNNTRYYSGDVTVNDDRTSYVYTFSHIPNSEVYHFECEWDDLDNIDKARPESVEFELRTSAGEVTGNTLTLYEKGNEYYGSKRPDDPEIDWTGDFMYKVEKKARDERLDPRVTSAEGYTSKVDYIEDFDYIYLGGYEINPFKVVLTHKERPVSISKVDADSGKEIAGAVLQVLDKDGNVIATRDEEGNSVLAEWTTTADGRPHVVYGLTPGETYTLHEAAAPEGYAAAADMTFKVDSEAAVTSTGTVTEGNVLLSEGTAIEKTKVHAQITWNDKDNIDGGRPESVELQLDAIHQLGTDGEFFEEIGDPVIVTEESGWQYTWENLDKKDSEGNTISYEVIVNYMFEELSYDETEDGIVASIKIKRYPYLQIWDVECLWNDADNIDNARPESVSFTVLSVEGEQLTEPLVLSDEEGWIGTIECYPGARDIQIDLLVTGAEGYEVINYPTPDIVGGGYPPDNIYAVNQTYEFIHTERPVSISKVDAESGKEIAGAKLQVLDKDGKIVTTRDEKGNTVPAEWTSAADGRPHVVYGLTPGETYILHEAEAPKGYETSEDTTFKIVVDVNEEDGTEKRTVESTGTVTEEGVILCEGKVLPKTDQTPACTVSAVDAGKSKSFAVTGSYGALTVKSSNAKVATATVSGTSITVKGVAVGTATLTITAAGDKTHNAATITRTVKITPAATSKLQVAAAANGKGFKLTWSKVPGATGYVIYRNDKKIKTVGNVATYTDTKANTNGAKYTYKVYAKAATGTSSQFKSVVTYKVTRPVIKALINSAAGKMTAKWVQNTKATGYQLQYCTKSTFRGKKTVTITKKSVVSKTISNLTKGKTYYVRLRTFKKAEGKTYFSAWSVTRKVKIKK